MNTKKHYSYSNTLIANEYEFHKRYEDTDNNIKYFNMLTAGKLKNDILTVSKKWEKVFNVPAVYVTEVAIEVGINRAYELLEKDGNLDLLFQNSKIDKAIDSVRKLSRVLSTI